MPRRTAVGSQRCVPVALIYVVMAPGQEARCWPCPVSGGSWTVTSVGKGTACGVCTVYPGGWDTRALWGQREGWGRALGHGPKGEREEQTGQAVTSPGTVTKSFTGAIPRAVPSGAVTTLWGTPKAPPELGWDSTLWLCSPLP